MFCSQDIKNKHRYIKYKLKQQNTKCTSFFCLISAKGDVTIIMADEDMLNLMSGKLNPQTVSI